MSKPFSRSQNMQNLDDIKDKDKIESPEEKGEDAVSGTESAPDSDDNVDEMTDEVGLYDSTSKMSEEVSIADQVENDEKSRGDIPPDK